MPSNENQPKLTKREIDMIKRAFDYNDQHRGENERWWEHKKKILDKEKQKQNPYLYDATEREHSHKGEVEDPEHDGRLKKNKEKKQQERMQQEQMQMQQRAAYLNQLKKRINKTAASGFDATPEQWQSLRNKKPGMTTVSEPTTYKPNPLLSAPGQAIPNRKPMTNPVNSKKPMPNYKPGDNTHNNFNQNQMNQKPVNNISASLNKLQQLRKSINVAISKAASIEERNELHAKLASVSADLIRMGALNKDNG